MNAGHFRRHIRVGYAKRMQALIKHPFFWVLTLTGNSLILVGGLSLYLSEAETQQQPFHFIDSLLWSTGLVTTVGYGNYVPLTLAGKISVLVLMMLGTFFVWAYMVFVVTALITPELSSLEKEMNDVERELINLKQIEESKSTDKKRG